MGELRAIAWGVLRLETKALRRWQARGYGLAAGLALLVAVSLAAGLADAAVWTRSRLQGPPAWASQRKTVETLSGWMAGTALSTHVQQDVIRNVVAWLDLQSDLQGLPRPLGREGSYVLQGLERALSTPYRRLATWLPYTLLVFALAKAFGGRGSLQEMLGLSALYVLPRLLDLLGSLPGWGVLPGPLTFLWGAAIYVKATAVANDLDGERALLAVALPGLAAVTLAVALLSVALAVR